MTNANNELRPRFQSVDFRCKVMVGNYAFLVCLDLGFCPYITMLEVKVLLVGMGSYVTVVLRHRFWQPVNGFQ